ncbi:MAG: radical SAM family heme chaperone HemW [Clostridia bacterium]|nr:radical SAM family heme chaperone HemW [Clostridia bacterium]
MSGIYIHIPFCKSKCSYCDFYSVAHSSKKSSFIEALLREIEHKKLKLADNKIRTIYFGGGTPSQLNPKDVVLILDEIRKNYNINHLEEITFEANPEDLNIDYLQALIDTGINRLSIGIQSLDDELLKFLRRRHSAKDAVLSVENARKVGFKNISIDLIYGIPGLSNQLWNNTLHSALDIGVEHLSAYHLGIEPKTLLYKQLTQGVFNVLDDDISYRQYCDLVEISEKRSIFQYEISNFAKIGFMSKHNSSYWNRTEYLGFGPSAHSFYKNKRAYNIASISEYCEKVVSNQNYFETETLTKNNVLNEIIMLSLRTVEGLNLTSIEKLFGSEHANLIKSSLSKINTVFFQFDNNIIRLSSQGMFVSDDIIERLIEVFETSS